MSTTDHRTPDEIERDIDDTRAELDATLDELQDRLNPQAAMDQAIAYARENGGLFGRNLMEQVRDNPLPAVLAGIGLTWLMTARDTGPSASRIGAGFRTVRHGMAGAASHGGESAGSARERMSGTAEAARDRMGAAASGASHRAGEMYDRAGASLRSAGGYARDNPLMLGMAAAAFGVLAAAMMPRTRAEEEAYEPLRERVRDTAREAGHRAVDQAERQAHKARDKAKGEVERRTGDSGESTGGERREATAAAGSGPGAARESGTSGLSEAERASRAQSVAGNATRPGPLPEEEGRPGRETGAADTGWVRPAGSATEGGRSNPRPGLSGSQQGLER